MSKSLVHSSKAKQLLYGGMYASYYFMRKQKRLEQNEYFCANPDLDMTRAIWNLLENKVVKGMIGKTLPKINVNQKIWIPMIDNTDAFKIENILSGKIPEISEVNGHIMYGSHEDTYNPETHV
jgi:hypothetical protein